MSSFELLPCAALFTDSSGNIQALNQELLRLLGGEKSDWIAKPIDTLFSKASRVFLQTHVWPMLLRDGHVRELKLQLLGIGGERLPILVNCQSNTVDGEVRFTWVLFVSLERSRFEQELLDSRKRAEAVTQKLAESERFLRTVADNMPSMIAYWDSQLLCRFSNAAYVEWFGKTPQDMQGASMRSVLG
ncbi:MAG: PAS domain-containing protein, partial [Rhodoferax sp.]